MKQKKQFSHAIQLKFFFLRLFTGLVILLVSGMGIYFVQKIAEDSSAIIQNQLPTLHATQEVHLSVLSAGLYGSALLSAQDDEQRSAYVDQFEESLERSYLLLDAIRLGSQSQAFKQIDAGGAYEKWKSHSLENEFILNEPSAELSSYAERIKSHLQEFEKHLNSAQMQSSVPEVTSEDGMEAATALSHKEMAITNLIPITEVFRQMEEHIVHEINEGVLYVHESNQSKQILISLISVLAVLISLFVGLVFSNRTIVRPLEELTAVAEEMANGKLSKRVEITSRDEIGKLAYAFNKMAKQLESSYDGLEKIVKEKTDALSAVLEKYETKNTDLEKSQMATINLLEDLEDEKEIVEERVKQRTAELEHEKNKLLQVTSNMRGGGILLDDSFEAVFVNEAAYKLLGVDKNVKYDQILQHFFAYFAGDDIKQYFKRCMGGETFVVPEIQGGEHVYEIYFHHLRNAQATTGIFILFSDITEAKLLERSKSELVAVASHQLRTPLTAMRGNVEMLIDESFGKLNKEQHELLDDVDVSTIRLITMVNEMLDITKIERGDLEMNIEKLNIKEVITSVMDDLSAYAARHEFTIQEQLPDEIFVEGDRVRLRQVFQNLIDNAIKYSNHPGKLDITARIENDMVEVQFKDNGIGVPKSEQPKLFGRFYRASNTAKTASSGSGLGLYIVKSIAQQLGGDIRFESTEEVGTTFFVTLPIAGKINV